MCCQNFQELNLISHPLYSPRVISMGEGGGCHDATCDDLYESSTCATNTTYV
jgi:hypothetical protein